jgi:TPP-dependent trihydroxycyclohexane-1,2-dione (THcHDO) dehydratase
MPTSQGEIFAAEGYAKAAGRVGVCIATSGPGATNLVTGLADAMMDSIPLVAITGQVRSQPVLTLRLVHECRNGGYGRLTFRATLHVKGDGGG